MKIDFANLQKHYQLYKEEIDQAIHAVLDKSNYIMGEEIMSLPMNSFLNDGEIKYICKNIEESKSGGVDD